MCFQKRKCYPSTSGVSFRKKLIQHAACGVGFWRMSFTGVKKQTFLRSSPKPSVEYRQQKWSLKYFLRSWAKILSYWIVLYFIFPFIAPKHSFLEEIRVFSIAFFLMGKYSVEILNLAQELMLISTLHCTLRKRSLSWFARMGLCQLFIPETVWLPIPFLSFVF